MLILTATNKTPDAVQRPDGTSDYEVWVGINQHMIWTGPCTGHIRSAGAAQLLRRIADTMEQNAVPDYCTRQHHCKIDGPCNGYPRGGGATQ